MPSFQESPHAEDSNTRMEENSLRALHARVRQLERDNSLLRDEIKERTQSEREQRVLAEALHDTAAALSSTLNLDELLDRILLNAGRVVEHDAANVMLLEDGLLRVVRHRGYNNLEQVTSLKSLRLRLSEVPNLAYMAETRQPTLVSDVDKYPGWCDIAGFKAIRSYAGAPIVLDGEVIGFVNLDSYQPDFFTQAHAQRLETFAAQAALGLRNARLFQNGQALAALEERQRLARDLHDAVSQTLWSASLITDVLPELWEQDPEEARRSLEKLRRLTYSALSEMRALLLELRPDGIAAADLAEALERLAASVAGWSGLNINFQCFGSACPLRADVRMAFYRIAQEALNNVVRHAKACQVEVHLITEEGIPGVRMVIADDGCGFEAGMEELNSLGLRIMRERAEKAGVQLKVESNPGSGTCVSVTWSPVGDERKMA